MNTSFGALLRYRRRSLGMSQAQLGNIVTARYKTLDIAQLERGEVVTPKRDTLEALADALKWPVGLLEVASNVPVTFSNNGDSFWSVQMSQRNHGEIDPARIMREELTALYELQQALLQWTDNLAERIQAFQSLPDPSEKILSGMTDS